MHSSPHQHPSLRRTRAAAAFLSAAVALCLTACGGAGTDAADGTPTQRASPAPKGVVTKTAAEKLIEVNSSANATRDEKLLSTVEAGQVNEQSRADYKQFSTWSKKEQKRYVSPFFPGAYTAEFLHKRFMNGGVIIPGEAEAVYKPARRPVIVDEYQSQAVAALSPKGKPRVLAFEDELVDSR